MLLTTLRLMALLKAIAADKSVDLAVPVLEALSESDIKAACGLE